MPPAPPAVPLPDSDAAPGAFAARVAQVAAERSGAWTAFADILATPDAATATRLRSGELTALWRAGVSWIGTDVEMFTGALMSLDVYARGAQRRSLDSDLAALALDHTVLVASHSTELHHLREVAQACDREAAAWTAGDVSLGRELRAHQHALVVSALVPVLPELGETLSASARAHVWRALGRLLLAFVSIETGQDYQRALLGAARARYLDPSA